MLEVRLRGLWIAFNLYDSGHDLVRHDGRVELYDLASMWINPNFAGGRQ